MRRKLAERADLVRMGAKALDQRAAPRPLTVPRLRAGSYAVAYVCPGCARYSFGRTFFVARVGADVVPRYRPLMLLRIQTS